MCYHPIVLAEHHSQWLCASRHVLQGFCLPIAKQAKEHGPMESLPLIREIWHNCHLWQCVYLPFTFYSA